MPSPIRPLVNIRQIAERLEEERELPLVGQFFRFLGRPGNAVRALATGNPLAAAKNLGQFALDLPTGGFLDRRLSLGNLFSNTGDITSRKDRVTGEDLIKSFGGSLPESAAGRFAVGLAADIATDPLSFLTFGGGGIAKGTLAGISRGVAAERLGAAMGRTTAGRAALSTVGAAERPALIEKLLGLGEGALERLTPEAAEGVRKAAIESRLIVDDTALRIGETPLVGNFWRGMGRFATAPGLAREIGKKVAPEAVQKIDAGLTRAWDTAKRSLYDRTLITDADHPAVQRFALEGSQIAGSKRHRWTREIGPEMAATAPEPVRREVGRRLHLASDEFLSRAYGKRAAERKVIEDEILQKILIGLPREGEAVLRQHMTAYAAARDELRKAGVWKKRNLFDADAADIEGFERAARQRLAEAKGQGPEALAKAEKELAGALADVAAYKDAVAKLAASTPKNADEAEKILGAAAKRLERRGLGLEVDNPFHIPRQLTDEARERLGKGPGLYEAEATGGVRRPGVKSTFLRRRDYGSTEDWLQAMAKAGREEGVTDEAIQEAVNEAAAIPLDKFAETDVARLALRYGDKHGTALGRAHLLNEAKKIGLDLKEGSPAQRYMLSVWEGTGRKPGDWAGARRWLAGFNKFAKPKATFLWPGYHSRNFLSAIFQTALDPDLSLVDGVRAALRTITDVPAVNQARKLGIGESEAVVLMRAAGGDRAAMEAARRMTIAGRPGAEVLDVLTGSVLSPAGGEADAFESLSALQRLGGTQPAIKHVKEVPGRVLQGWQNFGYSVAQHMESSFRTHAFLGLLGKGVEPIDAAKRVNKAFVDYGVQSKADQALRDLFPFVRFPIAITPPTVEAFLRRPGGFPQQFAREINTQAENRPAEERVGLPEGLRRGLAFPLGGGAYLGPLGLPAEAAGQLVEAVPTPGRGWAGTRGFLGGLSPLTRFPLESTTGTNFYTGEPFGSNRRAPGFLPNALTRNFRMKDGAEIREIPGWASELMRALPTARAGATIDLAIEEQKGLIDKLARGVFGLPVVRVDEKRGIMRALGKYLNAAAARGDIGKSTTFWARIAEGEKLPPELAEAIQAEVQLRKEAKGKK